MVGLLYCEHGDLLQTQVYRNTKGRSISVAADPLGPLPESPGLVVSLTRIQKERMLVRS